MPADPFEVERARARLVELVEVQCAAGARASRPPRIGPEAWRGPAYRAYAVQAEALAARLEHAAIELGAVVATARMELLRVLG